ncbi:MFS transporter [Blastomyces dermatitidis ER-3]|uniref:MFS transporter n=1 Tax=Ajellomyces dermatitidis (strain ER-3 / ATCC MYA-2586) TaxID=559297 RepID=A0ABM9YGV7_AJEDR|nr:MFS transporter [Blastomyces dermatitidis ER-3]EEQ87508.2 MFS transporter [Blastomyces dermatitidis ER-3]
MEPSSEEFVETQVPSNILGKFKRPLTYIGILTLGWSIVMTLTCVVKNFTRLVVIRFLLGWTSALVGTFSVLKLDGIGGLEGWGWIFLAEGAASVLLGVACCFILVDTPSLSTSWLEPQDI